MTDGKPEQMELGLNEAVTQRDPNAEFLLQYFDYGHLSVAMQNISKPFCLLAKEMHKTLPRNPERTAMLRHLLEAKDCAVRAALAK